MLTYIVRRAHACAYAYRARARAAAVRKAVQGAVRGAHLLALARARKVHALLRKHLEEGLRTLAHEEERVLRDGRRRSHVGKAHHALHLVARCHRLRGLRLWRVAG